MILIMDIMLKAQPPGRTGTYQKLPQLRANIHDPEHRIMTTMMNTEVTKSLDAWITHCFDDYILRQLGETDECDGFSVIYLPVWIIFHLQ